MTMRKLYAAIIAAALLLANPASATTYYVSQSGGNDSWTGTSQTESSPNGPKQSITAVATFVEAASAGDSVLLKRGDTWTGATLGSIDTAPGTSGSWINVGAYSTGALPKISVSTGVFVIRVRGNDTEANVPQYLKFSDIDIVCTNADRDLNPIGVKLEETFRTYQPHHITFDNVNVDGCFFGYFNNDIDNVTVENVLLKDNWGTGASSQGIWLDGGDSFTIQNSELDTNGKAGDGFDHNIYLSGGTNALIDGNTIHGQYSGIKIRRGGPVTITDNTIYDQDFSNLTAGADGSTTLSDLTITGNILYGSPRGINIKNQSTGDGTVDGALIANNVIYGHTLYGMSLSGTTLIDFEVTHNTVVPNGGEQAIRISDKAITNMTFTNNIMSGTPTEELLEIGAGADLASNITLNYNLYFVSSGNIIEVEDGTSYTTLALFRAAYSNEANGSEADPTYTDEGSNDYSLASGSGAIDAGTSSSVSVDIIGTSRPQGSATDIGAYEYVGVTGDFRGGSIGGSLSQWEGLLERLFPISVLFKGAVASAMIDD